MFLLHWRSDAHDQMQTLLTEHPDWKTEFIYSLRELTTRLIRGADTWGESRPHGFRLGYVGILQVLIWLDDEADDDDEDRVVEVVKVKLGRPTPK